MPWHWGESTKKLLATGTTDPPAVAMALLRAATHVADTFQVDLGEPTPHYSVTRKRDTVAGPKGSTYLVYESRGPGHFPGYRTGAGQSSADKDPFTVPGIIAAGFKVRVGMRKIIEAPWYNYIAILEAHKWLGLMDTFSRVKGDLAAIARGKS